MKFKRMFALLLLAMGLIVANVADVSATTMNYQGGWLAKTTYPAAAVVVFKNQTYYALVGANLNKNPVAFPTLWQPLGTFIPTTYKIGSRGPGGGWIFYVDLYDQYPGFTYLEAAPTDIDAVPWCNYNSGNTPVPSAAGWAAQGVGKGKANTAAILGVCSSGAAKAADLYLTSTKSDWFLPSLGEVKLMYDNLLEAGVGDFLVDFIEENGRWSSTENNMNYAWYLPFYTGIPTLQAKNFKFQVRAIRYF